MKNFTVIMLLFAAILSSCSKSSKQVELVYPSQDIVGECVTWMPELNKLLWIDITSGVLHELDPESGDYKKHNFPTMVSTITPYEGSTVLLSLKGSIILYNIDTEETTKIADLEPEMVDYRPNDGKCSPEGRFWVGLMKIENYDETGGLYCLDSDLQLRKVLDKQIIPNGICWNKAGDKMYYIDSQRAIVEEYNYDQATGDIQFNRVAITIPSDLGLPDGMTIDDEDNMWVGHWGAACVCKWNTSTGELMEKVDLPAPNVSTCTFGGKNQDVLYINTARAGLTEEQLKEFPLSGGLFKLQMDKPTKRYNHHKFVMNK